MTFVRRCQLLLAIIDYVTYVYTYRFLRAVKFRLVHEWMFRYQRRQCAFLIFCVRSAFRRQLRGTGMRNVHITHALYRRRGYGNQEHGKIYWEATLALCIWKDAEPLCGMAVEFWNDTLAIRQLQGAPGACIPAELKRWPQLFVRGCITFARKAGFKRVRLYRADQSIFYHFPTLDDALSTEERVVRTKELQQRMRRRYDGTARTLGLRMHKRWGEWVNPARARRR